MKKSLTFIFAAALWYLANRKRTKLRLLQTVALLSLLLLHVLRKINFETGDKIGVTITQNGDFVYAENKQMTYSDGVFAGDLLWYPEGNDKSQIVAYYPYKEGNTPVHLL